MAITAFTEEKAEMQKHLPCEAFTFMLTNRWKKNSQIVNDQKKPSLKEFFLVSSDPVHPSTFSWQFEECFLLLHYTGESLEQ